MKIILFRRFASRSSQSEKIEKTGQWSLSLIGRDR
jgi:hypothetical protein